MESSVTTTASTSDQAENATANLDTTITFYSKITSELSDYIGKLSTSITSVQNESFNIASWLGDEMYGTDEIKKRIVEKLKDLQSGVSTGRQEIAEMQTKCLELKAIIIVIAKLREEVEKAAAAAIFESKIKTLPVPIFDSSVTYLV